MTRILLALLALMGLIAQPAPAQARICAGAEVGLVQNGAVALAARTVRSNRIIRLLPTPAFAEPVLAQPALVFGPAALVRTTYIRIDRAAE